MDSTGALVTTFSTAAYRHREATAAWRELFGRAILGIDITPLSERFQAEARVSCWTGFGAIFASTSAAHQCNRRDLIVNDDITFGWMSPMAGPKPRWNASQLDRNLDLHPGDGLLMSNSDIGTITFPSDCRYVAFCIPRSTLKPLVPDLNTWFARRIPGTSPELQMLRRYVRLAEDEKFLATPELRNAFANHVVDLLALCIGANRDAAERAQMRGVRAARLQAMMSDIQETLSRPDLSVSLIAALHHVTPRSVQVLFEESGTTFTQFVQEQRLAAAYRSLASRTRANVPISTIAYESGFADLSNFNRVFRRRFGCTPGDVRRQSTLGSASTS